MEPAKLRVDSEDFVVKHTGSGVERLEVSTSIRVDLLDQLGRNLNVEASNRSRPERHRVRVTRRKVMEEKIGMFSCSIAVRFRTGAFEYYPDTCLPVCMPGHL